MHSTHNPKYTTRISQVTTDAVILPKREWRRTKNEAVYLTPAQILEKTQREEAEKQRTMSSIDAKRTQIIQAEQNAQHKMKQLASQKQIIERDRQLVIAKSKANEELDEVKLMNAEVAAARTRTLRDAELVLHQKRIQEEREREARDAQMLEEERRKAVKIYQEREIALKEQRKIGASMILKQIEDRKCLKKMEETRRANEVEQMKIANQLAIDEEKRLLQEKKQRQAEFLAECIEANKQSITRKQREREREIEEVNAIAEYQRQKAEKEAEHERQIIERKAAKEFEIAEIRRKQQRLIDTQAQEDELRARRVSEEKERLERQKELELTRKKREEKDTILRDREQFLHLKQKRLLQLANLEKSEFERNRIQAEKEKAARMEALQRKREQSEQYNKQLTSEIQMKRQQKSIEPLVHLDEQQHLLEEKQDYEEQIECIRQDKLAMLRSEGVPEKYLSDLANRRFHIQ